MSVLTVLAVPEGILFAADRHVTVTRRLRSRVLQIERMRQARRPKVLKWPNREAIVGQVGLAEIAGTPTDLWPYSFLGRNLEFGSLRTVAERLVQDLENDVANNEKTTQPLVIHPAAFEEIEGEQAPVIWFIHNTSGLTPEGNYIVSGAFGASEESSEAAPTSCPSLGLRKSAFTS